MSSQSAAIRTRNSVTASRSRSRLLVLAHVVDVGDDDLPERHLGQGDLLAHDQGQQQVERALEDVQVEIELGDRGHGANLRGAPGQRERLLPLLLLALLGDRGGVLLLFLLALLLRRRRRGGWRSTAGRCRRDWANRALEGAGVAGGASRAGLRALVDRRDDGTAGHRDMVNGRAGVIQAQGPGGAAVSAERSEQRVGAEQVAGAAVSGQLESLATLSWRPGRGRRGLRSSRPPPRRCCRQGSWR